MAITNEYVERALLQLRPRPWELSCRLSVLAEMDVFTRAFELLDAADLLMIERLASVAPKALHPQQSELLQASWTQGEIEARWSARLQAIPPREEWVRDTLNRLDERDVATLKAAGLSEAKLDALAALMDQAQEEAELSREGKVLSFPEAPQARRKKRPLAQIAAAVAVMGALAGAFLPGFRGESSAGDGAVAELSDPAQSVAEEPFLPAFASPMAQQWVPATVSKDLRAARNAGVLVSEEHGVHRDIEVERVESVWIIDDQGRLREFERPLGSEHVRVPVETQ